MDISIDAAATSISLGAGSAAKTIAIGSTTAGTTIALNTPTGTRVSIPKGINIGVLVISGAGSPNGSVTAAQGSLYLNTSGSGVADRAFINSDGATTWVAVTTAS